MLVLDLIVLKMRLAEHVWSKRNHVVPQEDLTYQEQEIYLRDWRMKE